MTAVGPHGATVMVASWFSDVQAKVRVPSDVRLPFASWVSAAFQLASWLSPLAAVLVVPEPWPVQAWESGCPGPIGV